jgi:hypothetical protein
MKGVNFINQGRAEAQRPKKKKEINWNPPSQQHKKQKTLGPRRVIQPTK